MGQKRDKKEREIIVHPVGSTTLQGGTIFPGNWCLGSLYAFSTHRLKTCWASCTGQVIEMTQFQPISTSSGEKKEPQQTFTQSSTSAKVNWFNPDFDEELAALLFTMFIPKFEYTSIEQVDPVDGWAIIGAIGGVWRESVRCCRGCRSYCLRAVLQAFCFCRCHPLTLTKQVECTAPVAVCEHVPLVYLSSVSKNLKVALFVLLYNQKRCHIKL